jgi:uncharacterized membrane protein
MLLGSGKPFARSSAPPDPPPLPNEPEVETMKWLGNRWAKRIFNRIGHLKGISMSTGSIMIHTTSHKSHTLQSPLRPPGSARNAINVSDWERLASVVGGSWLMYTGLRQADWSGLALAALGGGLATRGITGHCSAYSALDINGAPHHGRLAAVAAGKGVRVTRSVTINRSPQVLYRYWRNLENLPSFMSHLLSVDSQGTRSHWVARGPGGALVEWDAEIITAEPDRLIAWRSLQNSQIATAGSVRFTPLSHDRGTEVRVELKYDPPGGRLGAWLASLFGEEPSQQIREDLRRFKQLLEAGEIPTVKGQPTGSKSR